MELFTVGKVGVFLDAVGHAVEKRRGEEVKVLTLGLRVSPLDSQLASALLIDGLKVTLFSLHTGEPKGNLRRVDFGVKNLDRQVLTIFAAPDTEAPSIAFDQVRIHKLYVTMPKDRTDFDLKFKATFGPAGRAELEFVQQWLLTQRFVTFTEAEPGFDFEEDGEDLTDADEKARVAAPPSPMWDDEPTGDVEDSPATTDAKRTVGVNRKLHSHQTKKGRRRKADETPSDAVTVQRR